MNRRLRYFVLIAFAILIALLPAATRGGEQNPQISTSTALNLIYRQKYDDALNQLEQILETEPRNAEALTYAATANLYETKDFARAQIEFEIAFKAGGGATFFVNHSHESMTTRDVVDYCRGWLHLRRNKVEFVPVEGAHGFNLNFSEIQEFKRNRISKKAFHIKIGEKSQNFRGRSNTDVEALLIVALYNNFARN